MEPPRLRRIDRMLPPPESRDGGRLPLHEGPLTPERRRRLTRIIVASTATSFGLEISTKYIHVNPLAESLSFVATCILALSCLYLVFQVGPVRGVRFTGVLGAASLISSQVLNLCDDWRALAAVPILGAQGFLHHPLKNFFLVGGFALLLASCYSSLVESLESRTHLELDQARLSREVFDRKQVEQALRESEARFAGILDIAHEAVISIDETQRVIIFNKGAEQVFGYAAQEVVGKQLDLLIPEMFHEIHRRHVDEFGASPSVGRLMGERAEIFGRRKGGVEFPAEASITKLVLPNQKLFTVVLRDVTERKRAEEMLRTANAELSRNEKMLRDAIARLRKSHEELQSAQLQLIQAEKMKLVGQLAAGVAHEVKNPLAIILMGIEFLSNQLPVDKPDVGMVVKDMDLAVRKADAVIRGLLDFSAARDLDMRAENLNHVIEHALQLVKYELDRTRIVLEKDLATGLPFSRLDRNKLEQAFVNIFMNAIQAMPQGGNLRIRTYLRTPRGSAAAGAAAEPDGRADEPHGGAEEVQTLAVAEVDDTGQGIDEGKLSLIFDPFFSTKPRGKGTGLGLTVTKTIVELHGGKIHVRNRAEGGVRVTVELRAPTLPPIAASA